MIAPELNSPLESFSAVGTPSLVTAAAVPSGDQVRFGYEAAQASSNRKNRAGAIKSEDAVLGPMARTRLVSTSQDLVRNFELAGWMVRKHLDYVTECDFAADTGNQSFDDEVEEFIRLHSEPERCDVRSKLALDDQFRMHESEIVISGDILAVRTKERQLQLFESDLIRNPLGTNLSQGQTWVHGVELDAFQKAKRFAVWKRSKSGAGYEFARYIDTKNARLFCHDTRLSQTRGVSPLAAAVNRVCDVYEALGYALNKAKLSQLMGYFFKSALGSEGLGRTETEDGSPRYKIKFDGGVFVLEGDPGDEMQLIANNTPSNEFQAYMGAMIHCSLLTLDIPLSFFDETKSNFNGNRSAGLHYQRSCEPKQRRHIRARKWFTDWLIGEAILHGDLRAPRGFIPSSRMFQWIPRGMPWWNPGQEIAADINAIGAALDNPYRICRERGRGDFEDNVRAIAKAKKFAEAQGVDMKWAMTTQQPPIFQRDGGKQ